MRVVVFTLLEDLETNVSSSTSNIKNFEREHLVRELVFVVEYSPPPDRSNLLNKVILPNTVHA
jgi:hypothetical protein